MRKILAALTLIACFAGAGSTAEPSFQADSHFPSSSQARELLSEGVQDWRAGRAEEAAARFRDALKLEPDNELLYNFYLSVGDRELLRMEEDGRLSDVLKDIRRRAWIYQTKLRHDPSYITTMLASLGKGEEQRLVATHELAAIGPVAVPFLIARMTDNRQDDMRVYCRVVLTDMGYRAVIPLIEALKAKDERLIATVATVLSDIGDVRALPKLKQLDESKDTSDTVRRVVVNAIAAIARRNNLNGMTATAMPIGNKATPAAPGAPATASVGMLDYPANQLFFNAALRYFHGGPEIQDEVIANESLVWRWDESQSDTTKKLMWVRVPRYAWSDLIAEQILFDAVGSYTAFTAYQPLLAATLCSEEVGADRRLLIAKERTSPAEHPDETVEAITERIKALSGTPERLRMFGPANLYRAVQIAISSERYHVAARLMRLLEDRWLARADQMLPSKAEGLTSDKPGTVLVAALDHPERLARYQAAITLAHLDPALQFFNAEKVVPILADAVGEWGMRVVVVVDQDYRQRNAARDVLQRKGYLVYTERNGFGLEQRLNETPLKDAIVIAGDLIPDLHDQYGANINVPEQRADTLVAKLSKDWRTQNTPIFISLPEDPALASKIQTAFAGKVAGFVHKPFSDTELDGQIQAGLKTKNNGPANANRDEAEDISKQAALALASVDPTRTQYDLSLAKDALVGTIAARADDLRIDALTALGISAQGPHGAPVKGLINKVTDVYTTQDANLKPDVKAAFLYAIGQLNPSSEAAVAIITKALKDPDSVVHAAAAEAVGHAPAISNEQLSKYELQQRLDVRSQGAGTDDAAGATAAPAAPAPADAAGTGNN